MENNSKKINNNYSEHMNIEINPNIFEFSFMNERFIDNTFLKDGAMFTEYSDTNNYLVGDMILETGSEITNKDGLLDIDEKCTSRLIENTFTLNNEIISVFFIKKTKQSDDININTKRVYIKVGNNGLFIIDFISASVPVKVKTLFSFDDCNGCLNLKVAKTDRLVARKNKAGMKLFKIYNEADGKNAGYELFFKPYIFRFGGDKARSIQKPLPQKGVLCIYGSSEYAKDHINVYSIAASERTDIRSWHMYFEGNPCVHIEPSSRQGGYEMKLIGEKIKITDKASEKEVVFDLNKMQEA